MDLDVEQVRAEIPCLSRCVYTNTAGFAPLCRPVWRALREQDDRILASGLDLLVHEPRWSEEIEAWRADLAGWFGAQPDEIALGRALGEGLNIVLGGLDWVPGDEIIITDQEHPTALMPAFNLVRRRGVQVRRLCVAGSDEENLARFSGLLSSRTRLAAISAVTTETGVRLPVKEICALADRRGVPVYLDLAQWAGQLPLDLAATGCAFAAASGNKWLLGPLGTAFFYFRRDWIERLAVSWTGSCAGSLAGDDEGCVFAAGARRFEFGGRHWPLLGAMHAGIRWIYRIGPATIEARAAGLARALKAELRAIPGVELLTPISPRLSTGIVTFAIPGSDNRALVQRLRSREQVLCRATMFNGARISLGFFNTEEEVQTIAGAVREWSRSRSPEGTASRASHPGEEVEEEAAPDQGQG